jgi:hypothetical protein
MTFRMRNKWFLNWKALSLGDPMLASKWAVETPLTERKDGNFLHC